MARTRQLKPEFFVDEDLANCSRDARLCFAGLWTLADREGRLEDRPKRIKAQIFPYDDLDAEPLLMELAVHRFIIRYEVEGRKLIQIRTFAKNQRPHAREMESELPPPVTTKVVPEHDLGSAQAVPEHSQGARNTEYGIRNTDSEYGIRNEGSKEPFVDPSPQAASGTTPKTEILLAAESDFLTDWNAIEDGNRHVQRINGRLILTERRRQAFRKRIRDPAWDYRAALAKFPLKCFIGETWKPDVDWFLRPDSVLKILEGKYDWSKSDGNGRKTVEALDPAIFE